jgi:hypothetical protein
MKGLNYRRPQDDTGKFAAWVNDLRNQSGAYVIRSIASKQTLYVGESHTGNLAKTIKRHFYAWPDASERPHHVYGLHKVEIAVRLTPPPSAAGAQNNLILRLEPRDNRLVPAEANPF